MSLLRQLLHRLHLQPAKLKLPLLQLLGQRLPQPLLESHRLQGSTPCEHLLRLLLHQVLPDDSNKYRVLYRQETIQAEERTSAAAAAAARREPGINAPPAPRLAERTELRGTRSAAA